MGIRFEYGARKATNGPVIFFSDPVSEVNLRDEIRGAIESRLSFYAYHLPGDMLVSFGSSEGTVDGISQPGFVISPFLPYGKSITIPYAPTPRRSVWEEFPFPAASTTEEEYFAEIARIKAFIGDRDDQKVVAARVKTEIGKIDVAATFLELTKAYPDAYTFCFSTPQTGCWIGASPELLLHGRSGELRTMALAGTRPLGTLSDWDEKNIREQDMVTCYIVNCLRNHGLTVETADTYTRPAGNLEHLCTPIKAFGCRSGIISGLLNALSPTPAVAGVPRDEALRIIEEGETFDRAFYGGFCGPFHSYEDFTFSVILRCGRIEAERFALFAGGGITARSEAHKEWEETEMKLATLRSRLLNDTGITIEE